MTAKMMQDRWQAMDCRRRLAAIALIAFSAVGAMIFFLLPVRYVIVRAAEIAVMHRKLNFEKWSSMLLTLGSVMLVFSSFMLAVCINGINIKNRDDKALIFVVCAISVIVSIMIRLPGVNIPVGFDDHGFRQSQTAITVQVWLQEGYDALHYQTPVSGKPWLIPMEFPIYQTSVYLAARMFPAASLDFLGRAASVVWFYLSVFALWKLVRLYARLRTALCIMMVYLFAPFNIKWSYTFMIEYAAVSFSLLYVFCFISYWQKRRAFYAVFAVIFGTACYLCKVTSMIPAVIFIALSMLYEFYKALPTGKQYKPLGYLELIQKEKCAIAVLAAMALIPLFPCAAWLKWSDGIKAASPWTKGVTSHALKSWNYGTLRQKLNPKNWEEIFVRLRSLFLPFGTLLCAAVLLGKDKASLEKKVFIWALASSFAAFAILFNLYWAHEYYLAAVSPFLCISFGIAFEAIVADDLSPDVNIASAKNIAAKSISIKAIALCAVFIFAMTIKVFYYADNAKKLSSKDNKMEPGDTVKAVTEKNERILIFGESWSALTLYRANRKGFMPGDNISIFDNAQWMDMIKNDGYTTLVASDKKSAQRVSECVSDRWKYIIKIADTSFGKYNVQKIWKFYDDESFLSGLSMRDADIKATGDVCAFECKGGCSDESVIEITTPVMQNTLDCTFIFACVDGKERKMSVPLFANREHHYVSLKKIGGIASCKIECGGALPDKSILSVRIGDKNRG